MAKHVMFDANSSTLSVIREEVEGVAPLKGVGLVTQPNEISSFGNAIESTARTPLSKSRDAKKGTVTSLNSTVEFGQDLTISAYEEYMSAALSANWIGINKMKMDGLDIELDPDGDDPVKGLKGIKMKKPFAKIPTNTKLMTSGFKEEKRNGELDVEGVENGVIKIVNPEEHGFVLTHAGTELDPDGKILIEYPEMTATAVGATDSSLTITGEDWKSLEKGTKLTLEGFAKPENNGEFTVTGVSDDKLFITPAPVEEIDSDQITVVGNTIAVFNGDLTGDNAETINVTISAAGTFNITIDSITSSKDGSQAVKITANTIELMNKTHDFGTQGGAGSTWDGPHTFTVQQVAGQQQITTIKLEGADLSATNVVITYKEDDVKTAATRTIVATHSAQGWAIINGGFLTIPAAFTQTGICKISGYKNKTNNGIAVITKDKQDGYIRFAMSSIPTAEEVVKGDNKQPLLQFCGLVIPLKEKENNVDAAGNLVIKDIVLTLEKLNLDLKGNAIWIGGANIENQFTDIHANGLARVTRIEGNTVCLDKRNTPITEDGLPYQFIPEAEDTKADKEIYIFLGQFLRTYEIGSENYKRISHCYELKTTNDEGQSFYEYSVGNLLNTLEISMPSQEKATMSIANVSRKAQDATTTPNEWKIKEPEFDKIISTPSDILRTRVVNIDNDGLATIWTEATLSINNNVNQEYAIGSLEPVSVAQGAFEITLSGSVFFTTPKVMFAITNNCTVSADIFLFNEDGAIFIDIPTATLSDGSRDFTNNEKIKQNIEVKAYKENDWGYSISTTLFPYIPTEREDKCS